MNTTSHRKSLKDAYEDIQNEYLGELNRVNPCTLQFLDEAGVVHAINNRRDGHSSVNQPLNS